MSVLGCPGKRETYRSLLDTANMQAYSELLPETSRPWAPWYVVPADNKPYCQMVVADIVDRAVRGLNLSFPEVSETSRARLAASRSAIIADVEATATAHKKLQNFNHSSWKGLNREQKQAAVSIGYSKATWNMSCTTVRPDPAMTANTDFAREMAENIVGDKVRETAFHHLPVFKQVAATELGCVN